MSRPKGSKNKRALVDQVRQQDQVEELNQVKVGSSPFNLLLGIRHLGADSKFHGLWQLSTIDRDGVERVIIDATSHGSVITLAQQAIAKCL